MAKSVNAVTLLGNVGKDVEISFSNGLCIANLSLATNERQKVNDEWTDVAEWHSIVFYGRPAEVVKDYVEKGSKILVQGRLKTRSWEAKDGSGRRYRTEIIAHDIVLLGGKGERAASHNADYGDASDDSGITDRDIPF